MTRTSIRLATPDPHHLSADIGGAPLDFWTEDVPITRSPEAIGSALLEPALETGSTLAFDEQLDQIWIDGTRQILPIYRKWWSYPERYPIEGPSRPPDPAGRHAGVGACFTGGVDSFYTSLLGSNASRITHLVYVHGYDIDLDDMPRMQAFEPSLRRVAAELGRGLLIVRTNLRKHPLFAAAKWERSHGGALIAAGHVLSEAIGTLVIPSSWTPDDSPPWGSHFDTDPLHSSSRLELVHDDAELQRRQKLQAIASRQIVRENLRVCWENRTARGNCSSCEKCLRTMTILAGVGELHHYPVFAQDRPLAAMLDAQPFFTHHLASTWQLIHDDPLPADVRAAVGRLIKRSEAMGTIRARAWRRVKRLLRPG